MALLAGVNPPILRTSCQTDYFTPANTARRLFVNCAKHDSDVWPWNCFWTKTLNTKSPLLTSSNGYERTVASFTIQGAATRGQTVVRGMFAYVATESFTANIELSVSTEFTLDRDNVKLTAGLYKASDGALITSFVDTASQFSVTQAITLPATICPAVLWLSAAIQPTGETPTKPLPSTSGMVSFEAA